MSRAFIWRANAPISRMYCVQGTMRLVSQLTLPWKLQKGFVVLNVTETCVLR